MKNPATDSIRLSLMLNELRLPATKVNWQNFAEQSDKEGSSPRSPNTNSLNAPHDASSVILQKAASCREKPSTHSRSKLCR